MTDLILIIGPWLLAMFLFVITGDESYATLGIIVYGTMSLIALVMIMVTIVKRGGV